MLDDDPIDRNFILQQGLADPAPGSCRRLTAALLIQPRVITGVLLVGILTQSIALFAGLAAVLWWSALLPSLNPFDALYRQLARRRSDAAALPEAPPPRRFAQGLAGTFAAAIAVALGQGWRGVAYGVETCFLLAVAALAFGRLCFGSFVYFLLRGRVRFALQTLPWGKRM